MTFATGQLRSCPGRSATPLGVALQTRDPACFVKQETGVPHQRCTAFALHRVRDTLHLNGLLKNFDPFIP
jgi:hypothetical protein